MIDPKLYRDDPEKVRAALKRRSTAFDLDALLRLDQEKRKIGSELETLNAERNAATEAIAKLKRSGGDASAEIEKTRSLGDRIKELQAAFNEAEEKLNALAMLCPNLPHPSVPDGKTPADNKVAKTWGKLPPESQVFPHHLEIGEKLKLFDLARAEQSSLSQALQDVADGVRNWHFVGGFLRAPLHFDVAFLQALAADDHSQTGGRRGRC